MPSVPEQHRTAAGPVSLSCAVITCSDTRTSGNDRSGALIQELLTAAGHRVVDYRIVREESAGVAEAIREACSLADAVLVNGGTGIGPRDVTSEAVTACLDRTLPGFGELFRMLSYQEIGAAAMLSRAVGGVSGETLIFATPGSTAAVRLAMEQLIIPELRHLWGVLNP